MTSSTTSATGNTTKPNPAPVGPTLPPGLSPPPSLPAKEEDKPKEEDKAKQEKLFDQLVANMCAGVYEDVFGSVSWWVLKDAPMDLPAKRVKARGEQLAFGLKMLGWEDQKILLMVGLAGGITGDMAMLVREKKRREIEAGKAPKDKPKPKRPEKTNEAADAEERV